MDESCRVLVCDDEFKHRESNEQRQFFFRVGNDDAELLCASKDESMRDKWVSALLSVRGRQAELESAVRRLRGDSCAPRMSVHGAVARDPVV